MLFRIETDSLFSGPFSQRELCFFLTNLIILSQSEKQIHLLLEFNRCYI